MQSAGHGAAAAAAAAADAADAADAAADPASATPPLPPPLSKANLCCLPATHVVDSVHNVEHRAGILHRGRHHNLLHALQQQLESINVQYLISSSN